VQRHEEATIPGDFRPERQTVPRLRLPLGQGARQRAHLRRHRRQRSRCRAKRTSEERERCEAGLDNI
jgi:hypothetical protein